MYDAYSGAPFQVKISVLLDYPALGKVMGVVGSGGIKGVRFVFCREKGVRVSTRQFTFKIDVFYTVIVAQERQN